MPRATLYDHPRFYDVLFSWDRTREADLYEAVFERHAVPRDRAVLEVACGPGRVAIELARRGWKVAGCDRNPGMVARFAQQAAAAGVEVEAFRADMQAIEHPVAFAAAYNPMSSFRLLGDDAAVDCHLEAMAGCLAAGAVYVLDLDFGNDADPAAEGGDAWEMRDGDLVVRAAPDAVHVDDAGVRHVLSWGDEAHLRAYTWHSLRERVSACAGFEIEGWHAEIGRDDEGVSVFDARPHAPEDPQARAMVVLRRVGRRRDPAESSARLDQIRADGVDPTDHE